MNSKSKSLLVLLAFLLGLTSALAGTETRTVETTRVISASPQEVLDALGPMRMDYRRTVPRVRYVAELMGQLLHEVQAS